MDTSIQGYRGVMAMVNRLFVELLNQPLTRSDVDMDRVLFFLHQQRELDWTEHDIRTYITNSREYRLLHPGKSANTRLKFVPVAETNASATAPGCVYLWGLGQFHQDYVKCEHELDIIASSGYGYVRTFVACGWRRSWRGREVPPVSFTGEDEHDVPAWPNYLNTLRRYGVAVASRKLRLAWTVCDLQMFEESGHGVMAKWAHACGQVLASAGVDIASADVYDPERNWITNRAPRTGDLKQHIYDPLRVGYRGDFITL